jgi:bifunctional non-homologous end joining protein LigD
MWRVAPPKSISRTRQVRKKLQPLVTSEQKLTKKVRKPKAKWVEPMFVAEVEYRDITSDGLLRQSSFKGMAKDQ